MLQNPCETLGFKKNMVYKIPPGGEVNHINPVAYMVFCCEMHGPACHKYCRQYIEGQGEV